MLTVEDLHYAYDGAVAVAGLDLEVGDREIVALLGANGAGKSTTVKCIAGALRPDAGRIAFDGTAIGGRACHQVVRQGITLVPEGRMIFPQLNVIDNLEMGAYAVRDPAARAQSLDFVLDLFPRLAERRGQLAGLMSGGEQQMLAIARGLMSSPRLVILDEPSLGLMPTLVQGLFDLIRTIRDRGIAILLVEQNVHQSLRICDRGYVLEKGQVVLAGTGRDLLADDFVQRAFLGTGAAA
ncbi:MAG: ABC transporter ATP-binding protein [Sneathiellaceae bacterium]